MRCVQHKNERLKKKKNNYSSLWKVISLYSCLDPKNLSLELRYSDTEGQVRVWGNYDTGI